MSRFYPTKCYKGYPLEFYIPTATAIQRGELVKFTPGTGIAAVAGTDFDDPFIGASLEEHDGSTAGRESGTALKVDSHPDQIFGLKTSSVLTLTGGSTTTAVDSTLLPQTDDLWIGSYVEIVTCAADSDLVGKMVKVTDSTGSTGTLTFAALSSALASGDTIILHAGPLAVGEYGWDLDSDGTDIDYTTSGGEALQLVGADPEKKVTYWKARLHQFGNDGAAK